MYPEDAVIGTERSFKEYLRRKRDILALADETLDMYEELELNRANVKPPEGLTWDQWLLDLNV
jgi:hypothetical protein